jgi:hypothetical protein
LPNFGKNNRKLPFAAILLETALVIALLELNDIPDIDIICLNYMTVSDGIVHSFQPLAIALNVSLSENFHA